jgi:hypothetical protein
VSLFAYSLLSIEELKEHLQVSGEGKDHLLEMILTRVTDEIEDYLGRHIITRTTAVEATRLTEYHTAPADFYELRTLQWPIITVTTVHEEILSPRLYGASALLVEGTNYEVIKGAKPRSIIRRISYTGTPYPWLTGHRAIKVVYSAGYADTANVPQRIKAVALRYAEIIWDEHKRGAYGVSGQADGLGNYTRFASPTLSPDMKGSLANEMRSSFWESGERDS